MWFQCKKLREMRDFAMILFIPKEFYLEHQLLPTSGLANEAYVRGHLRTSEIVEEMKASTIDEQSDLDESRAGRWC